jgi:hypothetical protein
MLLCLSFWGFNGSGLTRDQALSVQKEVLVQNLLWGSNGSGFMRESRFHKNQVLFGEKGPTMKIFV